MPLSSINFKKNNSVQEQVYSELLDGIISGKLLPGETITMEGIAEQLNVSLTPVRIALQKLESGSFVTTDKNRRLKVAKLSLRNLMEIYEIRILLEVYVAKIACFKRSEESIKKLEKMQRECKETVDFEDYLEHNRDFHFTIYRESDLKIVNDIIKSLWNRVSPYLYMLFRDGYEEQILDFHKNHQGMVEAMKDKNITSIQMWLTRDITNAAELVKLYLEEKD